jgi:hypothetical protein
LFPQRRSHSPFRRSYFGRVSRANGSVGNSLFLAVVTPATHNFWAVTHPAMAHMLQITFMKNVALLDATLTI